jgi:hypothetical protein
MVSVYVVAASDAERDAERRLRWGDHWFKESLSAALREMGHTVTASVGDADVLINCHGCGVERLPEHTYNVLWIIGHPDRITPAECWQYDAVYSESASFWAHLSEQGVKCDHLPGASDMVPMPDVEKIYEKVFVGNARNGTRPCIEALQGNYEGLVVWGEGWEKLPPGVWQGPYYPHEQLNLLYAQAREVLNDSHPDMDKWHFHNPRAWDIKAVAGHGVPTFAQCAADIMSQAHAVMGLDLGCGKRRRRGLVGLDKTEGDGVVVHDLEDGLPLSWIAPDKIDVIVADNILEHIRNLVPLLNDCHRYLESRHGRLHVTVPNVARSIEAAFADPDHKRCFVPATFDYFNGEHPRWQEYGQQYGIKPWRVVFVRERERFIEVMLRPWVETPTPKAETPAGAVTITAERIANSRAYGDHETVAIS